MHVLVTRPKRDARALQSRLEALGCTTSSAPLLEIEPVRIAPDALDGITGIIVTSGNAFDALQVSHALTRALHLPIFAVGTATADRARALGFDRVIAGPGTALDLIPVVKADPASQGRLAHLVGDHLAVDLAGALAASGVLVTTLAAYRSERLERLPCDVLDALHGGRIDAVILMSPRTAEAWVKVVAATIPRPDINRLQAVVLSAAVSDALTRAAAEVVPALTLDTERILIAGHPSLDGLTACVERLAGQPKTL